MNAWSSATLFFLLILGGCVAEPEGARHTVSASHLPDGSTPAPPAEFLPGIYYAHPLQQGRSELRRADGTSIALIRFNGVGFDLNPTRFVSVDDGGRVRIVGPSGNASSIQAQGLFHPARPSLSPDGWFMAVQATTTSAPPGPTGDDFEIFVFNLRDGTSTQISDSAVNDESPEWVPGTDTIVWSSFSPEDGIDLHEYWVSEERENETREDIGAIHLDVSADGTRVLDPGRLFVYDRSTGQRVAELHDDAIGHVQAAGYQLDDRYPGQANRGTFPLDGAFSPDGSRIVFDGAVRRDAEYGVVMWQVALDGTDAGVVHSMIAYDPSWTNNHNFSALNPLWLG